MHVEAERTDRELLSDIVRQVLDRNRQRQVSRLYERIDVGDVPQQDLAIVSIPIADAADKLRAAGIRASVRAGAVRVGFHLYNTEDDVERLFDALGL